ncbi:MAG: dTDP-4-dehydrorhamnose reductase [Clostridia bacterium]|nr:dTDP-4-dehydrorhamnose reductase [Clostridia bacterium]
MKVLVTGALGQLGGDVVAELLSRGIAAVGSDLKDAGESFPAEYVKLDITDQNAVETALEKIMPDAVIHCAAWTDVDGAEKKENRPLAYKINAAGTSYIAKACEKISAKMLYISTDYVFNGNGFVPHDPDDKNFAPLNYYGETKLAGENAVAELKKFFVVRIAWVFGENGKNFVKTMLALSEKYDAIRVVNDQIGTPTYTKDLSRLLVDMILTEKYGFYHATNEGGFVSWADFAKEIFALSGKTTKVIPVTTAEYGVSVAKRPFNSRLDKSKLVKNGFIPLPDWKDALKRFLRNIGK